MLTVSGLNSDHDRQVFFNLLINSLQFVDFAFDLLQGPVVEFKQRALNGDFDVSSASLLLSSSDLCVHWVNLFNLVEPWVLGSKEIKEDLEVVAHEGVASSSLNSLFQTFLSELVVHCSMLRVAEHLISFRALRKLVSEKGSGASRVAKRVQLE